MLRTALTTRIGFLPSARLRSKYWRSSPGSAHTYQRGHVQLGLERLIGLMRRLGAATHALLPARSKGATPAWHERAAC
ncbi:MAG: hypothetical protein IPG11_18180 [Flavobacteriales bacterium]|nr:hypothetical protein [Flavobacteriales bacterium]